MWLLSQHTENARNGGATNQKGNLGVFDAALPTHNGCLLSYFCGVHDGSQRAVISIVVFCFASCNNQSIHHLQHASCDYLWLSLQREDDTCRRIGSRIRVTWVYDSHVRGPSATRGLQSSLLKFQRGEKNAQRDQSGSRAAAHRQYDGHRRQRQLHQRLSIRVVLCSKVIKSYSLYHPTGSDSSAMP